MTSSSSSHEREARLLLLGARTHLSDRAEEQFERLLQEDLDWDWILEKAHAHRVAALLHHRLSTSFPEAAPEAAFQALRRRRRQWTWRGLQQTQALVEVIKLFEAEGLPVLPLKGPTLGALIYGDTALRPFGDLDVLVPRNRVREARAALQAEGYASLQEMSPPEEAARFDSGKSYELVRDDTLVELHWDFLHPMHAFPLDPASVRARSEPAELAGTPIRVLCPEDHVIYLCAHGSKHFWERLSWICDVAETLRACRHRLRWPVLLEQAQALHARRMLFLGLLLAADLLDAPVPEEVLRQARSEATAQRLADRVEEELFRRSTRRSSESLALEDYRFHLDMRERLRDKWPYYRQLAWLAVEPTEKDHAWVDLRSSLHFAYYAVRPVRILWDGVAHLLGHSEARS